MIRENSSRNREEESGSGIIIDFWVNYECYFADLNL